ncbi:alpha/beta fold hydrolase [Glaciihabitans sp. UYNi722]|uniref:alpha/beta fold hydrolase n=1 Tax=Glaciihabitans sp. UYNi722 TaxID=3156344 RepID=UPI003390A024
MTSSRAHEAQLVPTNGIELCIQSFGDPAAPTLVLIGGAEASMEWWADEFCERLAAGGRHVIRYDTRDTGRSTTFPLGRPPYGSDALLADLLGLLDELGIAAAHVVAHSMGGDTAQRLTVFRPARVASLTLIAASPDGPAGPGHPELPADEWRGEPEARRSSEASRLVGSRVGHHLLHRG